VKQRFELAGRVAGALVLAGVAAVLILRAAGGNLQMPRDGALGLAVMALAPIIHRLWPAAALGGLASAFLLSRQDEPDSALAYALVGLAIALAPKFVRTAQTLLVSALLVSWMAFVGYAYVVKGFFGAAAWIHMDLLTMVLVDLLCVGLLLSRPDRGFMRHVTSEGAAGVMARRLLPASTALPLLLGWLALVGHRAHLFNATFGIALVVVTSILFFGVLVWLTYGAIDRSEREKLRLAAVLLEESERRNLARELHDEIGQTLTGLKLRLEAGQTSEARGLVEELMSSVRNLSLDLRPAMLDDLGLLPALLWLFERYSAQTGVKVAFEHTGLEGRFAAETETAAFRIVQEALTNVARHAGVPQAVVRVWADGRTLGVQIDDGGKGFDPNGALHAATGGLSGMRERATALGGQLTLESKPGQGARVMAELPLSPRTS
jgi:signal transduction histidine kinase